MNAIAQKLRSLINPAYAAQLGTESYERRVSAEEIERLELEVELLTAKIADCRDAVPAGLAGNELAWAVASTEGVAEYVKAAFKRLELDAARYRWIVDHISNDNFDALEAAFAVFGDADECTKDEFDAAIDASMKGGRK